MRTSWQAGDHEIDVTSGLSLSLSSWNFFSNSVMFCPLCVIYLRKGQDRLNSVPFARKKCLLNQGLGQKKDISLLRNIKHMKLPITILLNFRMYQFARHAIGKMAQFGCLKQQKFISYNSGRWKFKTNMLAGLVSVYASLPGCLIVTFLLCPHMAYTLSVFLCLLIRILALLDQGPTLITSFKCNCLCKGYYSHVPVKASMYTF